MPDNLMYGWDGNEWVKLKLDADGSIHVVGYVDELNDIGDVNVPAPGDDEVLYWDDAAGKWQPIAMWVVAHAATHEAGGADEINVAGLDGVLADPQVPIGHHTLHELGNADEIVNPLNAGALPALTNTRIWRGNAGNRPVEVAVPVGGPTVVRKTADETVNNSDTLQNDDDLLFAIAADEVWLVELYLLYDSGATPDLKVGWAYPAGCDIKWEMDYGWRGTIASEETDTDMATGQGAGSVTLAKWTAVVANGATAGNIQLQWAQNVADVSDTKVLTNSCLIAHLLA